MFNEVAGLPQALIPEQMFLSLLQQRLEHLGTINMHTLGKLMIFCNTPATQIMEYTNTNRILGYLQSHLKFSSVEDGD